MTVNEYFRKLYNAADYPRFLNCLNKLGSQCKQFLDRSILGRVMPILRSLSGDVQAWALQLVLWKATDIEDVISHLKPLFLYIGELRNIPSQRLCLLIILATAGKMTLSEIQTLIFPLFSVIKDHRDETCRVTLYKIIVWIIENHVELNDPSMSPTGDLYSSLYRFSLHGFRDSSAMVFWLND